MAQRQDEQPRERWPLNTPPAASADDERLASRVDDERLASRVDAASGAGESGETRVLEKPAARTEASGRIGGDEAPAQIAGDEAPGRVAGDEASGLGEASGRVPGDVDFSTYVNEELRARRARPAATATAGPRTAEDERFERAGYGGLYRSGEVPDPVLGLSYATAAPRTMVVEEQWASALRSFARGAVWALPAGALLLALSNVFGWPTETTEPALVSPGTWVVVTAFGLGLWLVGVVALAALVAGTRVRPWGYVAVVASALGVALLAPVVGAVGLGRPAISRTATTIQDDARIVGIAGEMQSRLLDNTTGRWLTVGGGVLLAVGAFAVAGAILGSRVLQRHDGWLVLLGLAIAVVAAYLSWEFLFVLAAMVILAGALGLAYTVSRLAPDGTAPPAY